MLFGNTSADVARKVDVECPRGETLCLELLPSGDDRYQLILRGHDFHVLVAVHLALLNRLKVG